METETVQSIAQSDEPVDQAARGVGRAIAFEVGYSHTVDERALNTARGYATMAGDSLGKDVRSCLRFGNAAAASFDSLIFEFAIVAIVTTFRCCTRFEGLLLQPVAVDRGGNGNGPSRRRQVRSMPRTDRRVWRGRIS